MRLLTRHQLRVRLFLFAAASALFTGGVWVTEFTIKSYEGVTAWAAFAALLGLVALLSMLRWKSDALTEDQAEWQPALFFRVLGGGLAFQAGVIGYFVASDVVGTSIGCAAFLFLIGYAMSAAGALNYSTADS